MAGCGVGEFVQNGAWRGSGFGGRRGGKKSDKLGRADVCKWVGEWDRGWWRKRRWEAGSLGGGGE